ncbi:hypothetical protein V1512DRAFT_291303 [Lipomyces arxii]|uniref:uncharacterized protein n=1 Tax=Lipomyces arxii TaxID=56418 RepID=UPI0034CD2727
MRLSIGLNFVLQSQRLSVRSLSLLSKSARFSAAFSTFANRPNAALSVPRAGSSFLNANPTLKARPLTTRPTILRSVQIQNLPTKEIKRSYNHWYDKPVSPLRRQYLRLKYRFVRLTFTEVCYGLIATFVAVYAVKSLIPRFPPLYFVTGWNSKWYTPVTCLFDHASVGHLFSNSLFLFCLTTVFPYGITAAATMSVFFVGGWVGLVLSELLERYNSSNTYQRYYRMVSGSSAAIYALCAVQTFIDPLGRIALYGIVPMRNWMFLAGTVAFELYGVLSSQSRSQRGFAREPISIDHMAHLGGVIAGALCYVAMRRFRPLRKGFDY